MEIGLPIFHIMYPSFLFFLPKKKLHALRFLASKIGLLNYKPLTFHPLNHWGTFLPVHSSTSFSWKNLYVKIFMWNSSLPG
jgi:hypothetical protein